MIQRYSTLKSLLLFSAFLVLMHFGGLTEGQAQSNANWQNLFGQGANDDVHAVVEGPNGEVYVGGAFTDVGTIKAHGLAMWDGSQWHNVGELVDGTGNEAVYALVLTGNTLYVAGRFEAVVDPDGIPTSVDNIAALDLSTNTWSSLGGGVTRYQSPVVSALALNEDETTLYAGGYFEEAGTVEADNVAAWSLTQQQWFRLNGNDQCNGANGSVNALYWSSQDDALYLGGSFASVNLYDSGGSPECTNLEVNHIAKWGSSGWVTLGGGVSNYGSISGDRVQVITQDPSDGDLYLGGNFRYGFNNHPVDESSLDNNDYTSSHNVLRWDGSAWHALGGGTQSPQYATVRSLLLDGSDLYVGGSFQYVFQEDGTRVKANALALWEGTGWTTQEGEGQDAYGDTELWTTLGTVAFYESTVGSATGTGSVLALALVSGDVFIGGHFSDLYLETDYKERRRVFNIGRWDGSDYYALGTGLDGPVTASASGDGGEVYLAGDFEYVLTPNSNTQVNHVAEYDPLSGALAPVGEGVVSECPDGSTCALEIRALEFDPQNGDLYMGAAYVAAGTSVLGPDVFFHWNGTAWNAPSGLSGPDWNTAPQIYDMDLTDEHVYVAGHIRAANRYGLARWNKATQQFEEVYSTPYQSTFRAVRHQDDQLYLVRSRDLYQYDLTSDELTEVASFGSTVENLALMNGKLYVGGQFDEVTYEDDTGTEVTEPAGIITAYDPGSGQWSFLDGGLQGSRRNVHAMTEHDGKLYVGGQFDQAGGQPASLVAAWDPAAQSWSALGSGILDANGVEVHTLASVGDLGFVGGDLLRLGGDKWSPFLAAWHDAVSDATEMRVLAAGDPPPAEFTNLALRVEFSGLDQESTVTAERFLRVPTPLPDDRAMALEGSWTIEQSGASSFSADVCFGMEELLHSEEAVDFARLEVHKRASSSEPWQLLSSEVRPDESNPEWVCALGIDSFSEFIVVAEESALPVELASFEAALNAGAVELTWETLSETSNAGFEVQRALVHDEEIWQTIGFLDGAGTTAEAQRYHFTDRSLPFEAGSARYRLRQLDHDGQATLSPEVELALALPETFALHGNFPNPFGRQTAIRYELPEASEVRLEVYDMLGRRVAVLVDEEQQAGRKEVVFEAADLPAGVYLYRLSAGSTLKTQQMVVVR